MKNNSFRVCSSVSSYHKAKRGGNKELVTILESGVTDYSNGRANRIKDINSYLVRKGMEYYNKQQRINKQNSKIMATKNLLDSALGRSVVRGVRSGMFANFCASLVDSLVSSSSSSAGVGRLSYAALVCAWRRDTANCGYLLNESEGRRIWNADNNDTRVKRIGVDGHWAWLVSPAAGSVSASDSVTVLVGGWLRSWSAWFEAVVQFGHYGAEGVPAGSCVSASLLSRVSGLWSVRGLTNDEKKHKKAVAALVAVGMDENLAESIVTKQENDNRAKRENDKTEDTK